MFFRIHRFLSPVINFNSLLMYMVYRSRIALCFTIAVMEVNKMDLCQCSIHNNKQSVFSQLSDKAHKVIHTLRKKKRKCLFAGYKYS